MRQKEIEELKEFLDEGARIDNRRPEDREVGEDESDRSEDNGGHR